MKRWKVILMPEAIRDLDEINGYIRFRLHEPGTAKKVLSAIRKELSSLDHLPERYEAVQEEPWNSRGLRKLLIGNYIALYWTQQDKYTVSVLRVFYAGRDIDQILTDLKDLP